MAEESIYSLGRVSSSHRGLYVTIANMRAVGISVYFQNCMSHLFLNPSTLSAQQRGIDSP